MMLDRLKAHYSSAKTAMSHSRFDLAKDEFLSMIELQPTFDIAHYNLASCYVELKEWEKAYEHYLHALNLKDSLSKDPDLFFNLGVCAERLNQSVQAIRFYEKALEMNPNYFSAYFNLGLLASKMGRTGLASSSFRAARDLNPTHPEVNFHLERLDGKRLNRLPTSHVQSLFDEYADHYDQHMQETLKYCLPEIMVDLMKGELHQRLRESVSPLFLLDLGCGTGLLAEAFLKNPAFQSCHIDGVDLSSKMIEVAKGKGIYQALICGDILHYLDQPKSFQYDGMMAADVLNYFGDLSELFEKVSKNLNSGGWFCFSLEWLEERPTEASVDWRLLPTLRYAHNQSYVKSKAREKGFFIQKIQRISARIQAGSPVIQEIYLSYFKDLRLLH